MLSLKIFATQLKGVGSSCYPSSIACEGGEQEGRCDGGAPVPRGQVQGRYGGERVRSQLKRSSADGSDGVALRWSCCGGNKSVCQRGIGEVREVAEEMGNAGMGEA